MRRRPGQASYELSKHAAAGSEARRERGSATRTTPVGEREPAGREEGWEREGLVRGASNGRRRRRSDPAGRIVKVSAVASLLNSAVASFLFLTSYNTCCPVPYSLICGLVPFELRNAHSHLDFVARQRSFRRRVSSLLSPPPPCCTPHVVVPLRRVASGLSPDATGLQHPHKRPRLLPVAPEQARAL